MIDNPRTIRIFVGPESVKFLKFTDGAVDPNQMGTTSDREDGQMSQLGAEQFVETVMDFLQDPMNRDCRVFIYHDESVLGKPSPNQYALKALQRILARTEIDFTIMDLIKLRNEGVAEKQ